MKKMNFFMVAMLCLCTLATGFTACSDDDNPVTPPDLGTPPFEAVSGKYDVTSADSPYESIELTASGNYIVTLSGASSPVASAAPRNGRSEGKLFKRNVAQTRATESDNYIYGTFTDLGNGRYQLEDFGTITLTSDAAGQVTGIEVESNRYGDASLEVEKEPVMSDDALTNALCRTWCIQSVREVYTDLETGEKYEETVDPTQDPDYGYEAMFSKAGTYLVKYIDGTLDMARWKWRSQTDASFYYTWEDEWYEEDYASISFSGNTAIVYEAWEEDGYREESWYTMTTDVVIPDDPTDEPQEPEQPTVESPVARVFGDKWIKTVSDDTYIYDENGFLVQIADEDDLEGEGTFFHYNYVTGAEGPDVYTLDGTELEQTATLGENGFVASVHHEEYDCVTTFEYDEEGHIIRIDDGREERHHVLTWENGDLVRVEYWYYDETPEEARVYTYTYSDQPSNGIMRFYNNYNIDLDVVEEFYYAGLMGIPTKHLIETETNYDGEVTRYEWTDTTLTKYNPSGTTSDLTFSFYE